MTRTDHKNYIASEWWLQRRKLFLEAHRECNRCGIEREAARELYDQDLNVHHRNYQNKGAEKDEDLEALCRRCHEIESKGKSTRPEWNPDFPVFVPDECGFRWNEENPKSVWRIHCPQCGFDYNHFVEAPLFDHEVSDEPFMTLRLQCENSHLWELAIIFHKGNLYAEPKFIRTVTPEDAEHKVLR